MTTTETATPETTSPFDELVFESIPEAAPRPPGKGREPVKWEELLAPLQDKLLETPARIWTYANKSGAMSRVAAVRTRLSDFAPALNWEFKVRPVPDTSPQQFGVYAVFHGNFTSEEMVKNAQDRAARREKAQVVADARKADAKPVEAPEGTATPEAPAQTAKEKLAAKASSK